MTTPDLYSQPLPLTSNRSYTLFDAPARVWCRRHGLKPRRLEWWDPSGGPTLGVARSTFGRMDIRWVNAPTNGITLSPQAHTRIIAPGTARVPSRYFRLARYPVATLIFPKKKARPPHR